MTHPLFDLTGKIALVTGATSGIGRATAIGLGKAGYRVAILGRREEELQRQVIVLPDVREALKKMGTQPDAAPGHTLTASITNDLKTWTPVVKASGFSAD